MHGVQPSPKSTPSKGAPSRPIVGIRWKRHSRLVHGSHPRNASPRMMVRTPRTLVIWSWYSISAAPSEPASAPSATKTAVKPATKSTEPASSRPRLLSARSAPTSPVA